MILVTGATGHIGNVLVRALLVRGEKVRALVLPGEDCSPLSGLGIEMVEGDVLNIASLRKAFSGIDTVFHLAGIISIMPGKDDLVHQVNVQGTRNVLQVAKETGVRRLVYTSSIHAITRAPHGTTIDESLPFDPDHAISAYDRSKAEASLAVLDAIHQGLDVVVVCPTGVIGPYDFRSSEMGALIQDCMKGGLQFSVDGAYDFVDVRDVAQGEILALEKGRRGESYILSGERISIPLLIDVVRELVGIKSLHLKIPIDLARFVTFFTPVYYRLTRTKPRFTPYALATVYSNSNISNAKARRELGYRPRRLQESLCDTVRWFKEAHFLHRKP